MELMLRWFILSDSPPEKDVQWSDIGVVANKFLQRIWNLNHLISIRKNKNDVKLKINSKQLSINRRKTILRLMILDLMFQ